MNEQGFGFFEMIICLFLLSVMLLGLENASFYAAHQYKETWQLHVAVNQMTSIKERLQALSDHEGLGAQVEYWNAENRLLLPGAVGEVSGRYPEYVVSLVWKSDNLNHLEETVYL